MKRARPWLYFLLFIFTLAGLSAFRDAAPEIYRGYAVAAVIIWFLGVVVLSQVTLQRRGRPSDPADQGGFGMANLPLPRSWKRWIYDERGHNKKNIN
jgi:hypothetical protein